jgi:sugar phosphate isomerase/epimerase
MNSPTRRAFLTQIANTMLAASCFARSGLSAAFLAPSGPDINFPSAARDRISVASWPFRAYIDSPTNHERDRKLQGMDLKEFSAYVLAKFNVRNIEPYSRHFSSTDEKYLASFHTALQKTNTKVVNIAVDGDESFYDSDPGTRKKAVVFAKKWIAVAGSIGSPSVRTHNVKAKNSAPDLQRTVDSLKQVADYGADKNIVVNLENDDPVSEDPFFLVKVIEAVGNPYLHALPDFANSMQNGDADFNYRAVESMFRHAYCICHVKDGEVPDHGKAFTVDLAKTFRILKSSGFRGYCSMEFDGQADPNEPTAKLVEATVRYLS